MFCVDSNPRLDLYRVNLSLIGKKTTYTVSNVLSTCVLPVSQVEITGRNHRFLVVLEVVGTSGEQYNSRHWRVA